MIPPLFLRHMIPWLFLHWYNDHLDCCWTGIVMWKLGYEWEWKITGKCFDSYKGKTYDYCGKYQRFLDHDMEKIIEKAARKDETVVK